jgi:anaerobic selenocysteine-containing dehydrogenase
MFPATAMAEEMDTPGQGQIRGLVTIAGNPVLSVPGSERLDRALGELDLMVSIDLYINETTRHAHYILPPRFGLERDHYDVLFHALAVRNTVKWSSRAVNAEPSSLSEWTILYELATRLFVRRVGGVGLERWSSPMRRALEPSPKRVLDALIRFGPYGSGISPFGRGLTLAKIEQAPHGLDLGPLVPMRRARVSHVGGLVELGHVGLLSDAARVSQWLDAPRPPLVLIGRRHLRSNNSWMHNAPSLVSGKDRATLLMHPDDAAERGLQRGMRVHVSSVVGRVEAKLDVSDSVARGVVSLPHGFGHGLVQSTMRVAGAVLGPNANAVIDAGVVEPLTGTAVLNGVPVDVRALA